MAYTFVGLRFGSFTPQGQSQEISFKKVAFITENKDGSHWVKECKLTNDCLDQLKKFTFGTVVESLNFDEYGRLTSVK